VRCRFPCRSCGAWRCPGARLRQSGCALVIRSPPAAAAALLADRVEVPILNRGIAGNRLRADPDPSIASFGRSGLSRFDEDVLGTAGATDVVVALGTNDLGLPGAAAPIAELPSPEELIDAYEQLIERAAAAGVGATIATITPFLPRRGVRPQPRAGQNDCERLDQVVGAERDRLRRGRALRDQTRAAVRGVRLG